MQEEGGGLGLRISGEGRVTSVQRGTHGASIGNWGGVTVTTGFGAGVNREESSHSSWRELAGGPMTEYVGCLRSEARRKRDGGRGSRRWAPFQRLDGRRRQRQQQGRQGCPGEQMSHRSAFVPRVASQWDLPTHGAGFVGQLDQRKGRNNRSGSR